MLSGPRNTWDRSLTCISAKSRGGDDLATNVPAEVHRHFGPKCSKGAWPSAHSLSSSDLRQRPQQGDAHRGKAALSGQSAGETLDTLYQSSLPDNNIVRIPLLTSCSAKVPRSVARQCHDSIAMVARKVETYTAERLSSIWRNCGRSSSRCSRTVDKKPGDGTLSLPKTLYGIEQKAVAPFHRDLPRLRPSAGGP